MSLRNQLQADLSTTLTSLPGWGSAISVTDPAGLTVPVVGQSGDIGQLIDPETGLAISGRLGFVCVSVEDLEAGGFTTLPVGISDPDLKPWLVEFQSPQTSNQKYKVKSSRPDRTFDVVTLILELWDGA